MARHRAALTTGPLTTGPLTKVPLTKRRLVTVRLVSRIRHRAGQLAVARDDGHRLDPVRRHRPCHQVSLSEAAAHRPQQFELLRALDPLGHDLDAEVMPDLDDRAGQHGQRAVGAEASHERRVDLDDVDRQLAQVGERGVASAEVVDGQPDAELAEPGKSRP